MSLHKAQTPTAVGTTVSPPHRTPEPFAFSPSPQSPAEKIKTKTKRRRNITACKVSERRPPRFTIYVQITQTNLQEITPSETPSKRSLPFPPNPLYANPIQSLPPDYVSVSDITNTHETRSAEPQHRHPPRRKHL